MGGFGRRLGAWCLGRGDARWLGCGVPWLAVYTGDLGAALLTTAAFVPGDVAKVVVAVLDIALG